MTEAEWTIAAEPLPMLEYLQESVSARRLIMFAHSCAEQAAERIANESSNLFLLTLHHFADGKATTDDLASTRQEVQSDVDEMLQAILQDNNCHHIHVEDWPKAVADRYFPTVDWDDLLLYTQQLASCASPQLMVDAYRYFYTTRRRRTTKEFLAQSTLLRDIIGNPFHPVLINPGLLNVTVMNLAQAIYENLAFDIMPILADALEEAGCTDGTILEHCRQQRKHVRGCWVVDLLLGKK